MFQLISTVFLIHVCVGYEVLAESRTNFDITRCEKCATDGPLEYSINITKYINQNQYLNLYMMLPIPFDGNIGMNWTIESSLNGDTFLLLFVIKENDFSKALNKYMGEFLYEVERAAQLLPGVCPILAGRYHVHHHLLNFNRISLQTFPVGTLRFQMQAIDKKSNKIVFCVILEAKNLQN